MINLYHYEKITNPYWQRPEEPSYLYRFIYDNEAYIYAGNAGEIESDYLNELWYGIYKYKRPGAALIEKIKVARALVG